MPDKVVWFNRRFFTCVAIILIGIVLNGCVSYRLTPPPKGERLPTEQKFLHLNFADGVERDLYMVTARVSQENLVGIVKHLKGFQKDANLPHIIELTLKRSFAVPSVDPGEITIPFSDIRQIESYEYNIPKSVLRSLLAVLGFAAALFLLGAYVFLASLSQSEG